MLKFAIIGCGRISGTHLGLLADKQIEGAELIAVCDLIEEKARAASAKYKVPFYKDIDEMMRSVNPDAVVILTPSGMHPEHAVRVAKYGNKSIVVEKPMALALEDADWMIRECEAHNCRLFVVKQNRFNVPVRKLRETFDSGRFGKIVMGTVRVRWKRDQNYYNSDPWRGTWKLDGGVLSNQAIHHIDLLQWFMGDVESIFAKTSRFLVDIEAEDSAVAVIKFKSGALGVIEATNAARPLDMEGSLSILGERGSVVIAGTAVSRMQTWNFVDKTEADENVLEKYSVNPPSVYGYGHKYYYEHIVDCILNNKKPLIDGSEGRKSLAIISAIYESAETGREIFMKDFKPEKCRLGRG